jgi:hypothetical protein
VLGDQGLDPRGDLVDRLAARDRREQARCNALLRVEQPLAVGVLRGQLAPLRAGEAVIGGVRAIARHAHGAAVLDLDEDPAVRVAEAADGRVDRGRHCLGAYTNGRARRRRSWQASGTIRFAGGSRGSRGERSGGRRSALREYADSTNEC